MKHLKTFLVATAIFIGASSFTYAQSKIAHINTKALIEAMPQMKVARAEMEKLTKTYEVEIQNMATELQSKAKQYDAESSTKTQEENSARMQEISSMEKSIREYQGSAQQDLQKKEFDLLKPITENAKAAIEKVARAQGFQYVLDSSPNSGVILAEGKDLMSDVKKELGF